MNQVRIFYGTAGFLVEKVDREGGEGLVTFLENEGFKSTKWIDLPKNGLVHVNVESMCYGYAVMGIKTASHIYDEAAGHPFTVLEFKTIWNVLKKHGFRKIVESRDRKCLDSGYSCFIVKEDNLSNPINDFWTYLNDEKFKSLKEDGNPGEWVLINVGNSTYLNSSDNPEILSYVRKDIEKALTCDEFKIIWEVIRKHR